MRMGVQTDPRLTLCVGVVLALHVCLLWSTAAPMRPFGSPARAFTVRSLELPAAQDLRELAPPQPMPSAFAADELHRLAPLSPPVMPHAQDDPHPDAGAPDLHYPDAPLPGGRARATVALSVERDGYVRGLAVEPRALPPAFERAVERAFEGSLLTAEMRGVWRGDGRADARICVEVKFQEGEQPSWQTVAPTGICAG